MEKRLFWRNFLWVVEKFVILQVISFVHEKN